jgi:hypothetical protein
MARILAIDLGKFKSVACWYDADSGEAKFQTVPTSRQEMRQLLLAREVVVAYLDDPKRFTKGSQISSFAGLVPRQYQSGETDRRGRISKRGPGLLRKMLAEGSWVMLRYNPWAQRLVQRISRGQRTRKKQAVIALARKLLVRCWAMLRDGQPWRAEEAAPMIASA